MARTMDPTSNTLSFPNTFVSSWTEDSWYNVYSWVNSQSNDSETGESVRSSTSSQPQASPSSADLDDRDHPLLCDAPSSPIECLFNNNNVSCPTTATKAPAAQNTAPVDWFTAGVPQTGNANGGTVSDYELIQELLRLNLNPTPSPSAVVTPPQTSHLFSSAVPSTSSPWSLPTDEYRPAPIAQRKNVNNAANTNMYFENSLSTQASNDAHLLQHLQNSDLNFLMKQQQQQKLQLQPQYNVQQQMNMNQQWPTKMAMQKYNIMLQIQTTMDEVNDEYRQLEKERKQTEAELARNNLGKKITSSNALPIPRLPAAPSRIDRLIVDFFREHARISTLLGKMEQLRQAPVPLSVHKTLQDLLDAVTLLQHNRTHERNLIMQQLRGEPVHYDEDKEASEFCQALLFVRRAATRVRAANWCSLMITLGPLDYAQQAEIDKLIISDYNIGPPPIRPRAIKL